MYQEYWKLKEKPFQNTPDPRFLYYSSQHEETLLKLVYAVKERLGAAVLTGVFGCGKTLLGQALFQELPEDKYKIAFIANPQMDYVELLRSIVRHLKSIELPAKKTELSADYLLELLYNILINNMRDGKETVIVIDEAHIIKDEKIFEEMRLLLNFQLQDRFLLTLLIFGQPELRQMIEDNKQLEQRVAVKCHLESLTETDTKNYIIHRLKVAGSTEAIFSDAAIKIIFEHSGGIPRRINRLCDLCLLAGFGQKVNQINEEIVNNEWQSLGG
jgi:general secretion pathway protein A